MQDERRDEHIKRGEFDVLRNLERLGELLIAVRILGCPGADGLPLIAFHEIYDPDNYANVATVCRQALPVDTASGSSRKQ